MDNQNDITTLASIENEITSSSGYSINSMMEALDLSLQIFIRNYGDAKRAYDFLKDPAISLRIFQPQNKVALMLYLIEIYRTFFNFEASAASLIDHSRVFINKYEEKNTTFCREYQNKIEADFISNPLAKFIKDIRNFVVHKGYPIMNLNFPLVGNRVYEYLLNSSSLLEWDGWTSKAREYINSQGETIRLYSVIEEYYKLVDGFYSWMYVKLKEIHAQDFSEVNALITKRNEFLGFK
jgi:hypothetical protein